MQTAHSNLYQNPVSRLFFANFLTISNSPQVGAGDAEGRHAPDKRIDGALVSLVSSVDNPHRQFFGVHRPA